MEKQLEWVATYLIKSYIDDTEHLEQDILFTEWLESAKYLEKYKYHIQTFEYLIGVESYGKHIK